VALQEGVRSHAAGHISFIDKALQHVSAQQWIHKGLCPRAQEPAFFGHFTGAEPDFTEDFPQEADSTKSEAESPTKQTGCSVIAKPWEHIFPPQIFHVLLILPVQNGAKAIDRVAKRVCGVSSHVLSWEAHT
jgi:hypothetical protein